MKVLYILVFIFSYCFILPKPLSAQETPVDSTVSYKLYIVVKNDGSQYMGTILKNDAKEVILKTQNLGEVAIPKHEIKEIREVKTKGEISSGKIRPDHRLASRYFLTASAFPIEKGDSYFRANYILFEGQYAFTDNFSAGLMTTFAGIPIIVTPKLSFQVAEKWHLGVGALVGTLSWARPQFGGAFAYGLATYGSKDRNITFGAGFGGVWGDGNFVNQATPLLSVDSHLRIGSRVYFNFESLFIANGDIFAGALIPGIRFVTKKQNIWDFGFVGAFNFSTSGNTTGNGFIPIPIPMIGYTVFFE